MYTINTSRLNTQKCQFCSNKFLEYIGTQAWCLNCKKITKTIEQQIKVVPKAYQSNCKDKINSAQLKITQYLNQFSSKYAGILDTQQLNYLYKKVLLLRDKKGVSTKNYRQNAAVIVYLHFKQIHKLSIKQFCKMNQIQQKSFNRNYLIYQKLLKQIGNSKKNKFSVDERQTKHEDDLKFQFTQEQDEQKNKHIQQIQFNQQLNQQSNSSLSDRGELKNNILSTKIQYSNKTIEEITKNSNIVNQVKQYIHALFDYFFQSLIYKDKQNLIIKQLAERVTQLYKYLVKIFSELNDSKVFLLQRNLKEHNFYKYLFFIVLKSVSHKTSQLNYRNVVKTVTGQTLKVNIFKDIIKIIQNKDQTSSFSGDSVFFVQNSGTTGSQFVKLQQRQ